MSTTEVITCRRCLEGRHDRCESFLSCPCSVCKLNAKEKSRPGREPKKPPADKRARPSEPPEPRRKKSRRQQAKARASVRPWVWIDGKWKPHP